MQFWRKDCQGEEWVCRAKLPHSSDDDAEGGLGAFFAQATVDEYVEYALLVHRYDRKCLEENSVAYPRVAFEGWPAFLNAARLPLLAQLAPHLGPKGLKDHSQRWLRLFAGSFSLEPLEALARLYRVSLRATGTLDRLHAEPHGAHLWLNQIEGRRVFFLFPPQEAANLYAGYSTCESPVDVYFPSAKRHPKFSESKAHVVTLYLGQTLIIPTGWWWYSVALEPCVTLSHQFWSMDNKVYFTEYLRANFDFLLSASRAMREGVAAKLDSIHRQIMADEDSDTED